MNVPPKLLSWPLILIGLLWLVSAAVHGFHYRSGALESLPGFWLAMFYVGGPIVLFIAAMLITIRRRERSPFERVDRVALWIAGLGAVAFAVTLTVMLLELQRLKQERPNQGAAANGLSAVRSSTTGIRERIVRSTVAAEAVAELGR